MPIDPDFRDKREKVDEIEGIAVWGPRDPPEKLGIIGTTVAVDWDICEAHGVCLDVCPVQLYDWYDTPDHPSSERKAFPAREDECIQCLACQNGCPVEAIVISME
jgi:NAD-dependent dihydropyrimidine dehydrogenase PreA subunit